MSLPVRRIRDARPLFRPLLWSTGPRASKSIGWLGEDEQFFCAGGVIFNKVLLNWSGRFKWPEGLCRVQEVYR